MSVCPAFFLCLLHRLAAVVTTPDEFADCAWLPEPVGTWLPATVGLVLPVAGELAGGDDVGGDVVGAPDDVVGEGLDGGVRPGSTAVLLLAQLAELEGLTELPGLPEEAGLDAFTAVDPLPPPGW